MRKAEMNIDKINKAGELNMCVKKIIFISLAGLILTACESDKSTNLQDSLTVDNTVDVISNYDLGESVIPFPNDFLFSGTTTGTLNIPVADPADLSDPQVALNGVDGFSTVAPMSTGFTAAIDAASISATSVRVYPITKGGGLSGPATAVAAPLVFGVDYVAALSSVDTTNSTLAILPLKPLAPKSSYAVVITNDLKSTSGRAVGISGSYALTRGADVLYDDTVLPAVPPSTVQEIADAIKSAVLKPAPDATDAEIIEAGVSAATLEALRLNIVKPTEDAIVNSVNTSIASNEIILHWTFTTQSITDVLAKTRDDIIAAGAVASAVIPVSVGDSPLTGVTGFVGADIYTGSIDVPYFLTAPVDTSDTGDLALDSFWHGISGSLLTYLAGNVSPVATSTQTIPVMITIPKAVTPAACPTVVAGNWPVVIYQHGITTNRATMLAVADSLANACFAVVAIDMPLHGITGDEDNPLIANLKGVGATGSPADLTERTFDLNLVTQDADGNIIAEVADGVIDTSGRHFINLTNLQNTRDNVRQAVSDLFALKHALPTMTVGANDFDTTRVYFLGHSLGAMVGTTFTAIETNVSDAVFAFGGASLAKILDGSATFGPTIAAGLAVNGVIKGTADYEAFLGAAQTVVDSADPVNHATTAAANRGVLFFEIVGGASSPSDLVVPNTVPDGNDSTGTVPAPLAGTEPQLALMGLTHVNTSQGSPISGVDLKVVTKYIAGDHASLLLPDADAAVTTEIQSQAATFFATDGFFLNVSDNTVLQAP